MFQRLNTGGSHLSAQEIRNCILVMRNESVYKQIKKLSEYDNLEKLYNFRKRYGRTRIYRVCCKIYGA